MMMNLIDYQNPDESLTKPKMLPKHKRKIQNVYKGMKEEGLIGAGKIVTRQMLEEHFRIEFDPKNPMVLIGKVLVITECLKSEGYAVTQTDIETPGFRILESWEMNTWGLKNSAKAMGKLYEVSYVLAAHNTSALDERQKKELQLTQKKAAQSAMILQKILLEDQFF